MQKKQNKQKPKLLLLDNNYDFHEMVKGGLARHFEIISVQDIDFTMNELRKGYVDVILFDLKLSGDNSFEAGLPRIKSIKKKYPHIPLIVVTNDGSRDIIVKAIKNGADDFFYKKDYHPLKWKSRIELSLKRHKEFKNLKEEKNILEQRTQNLTKRINQLENQHPLIGNSPQMAEVKRQLKYLGNSDLAILITGETGTGKEVATRYLHHHGSRSMNPLQAVHLSSIQETLLESRLFGHKKGAFTGAISDQIGLFHEANTGILFLDEIGEINKDIQIKLLRFLEDKIIRVIGSNKDIQLDVQIVAATNKNLNAEIEIGNFRSDLYQRLKVFPIELPPLRERIEDLPLLISHFLQTEPKHLKQLFSSEAMDLLASYSWPGNVRELNNVVKQAEAKRGYQQLPVIDFSCLSDDILNFKSQKVNLETVIEKNSNLTYEQQKAFADLKRIELTFIQHHNNKGATATELNTDTDALRYKVKKLYKKHPDLFVTLPIIKKLYKLNT